jgi:DNA processing protein
MRHTEKHLHRLGLLLATSGARVRRLAAQSTGEDLLASLAEQGVPRALLQTAASLAENEAPEVLSYIGSAGWRWVIPEDDDYPPLLRAISDPPLGLFVRGRLCDRKTVAVVGSRKASPYGRQVARLLGEELGRAGLIVVSGMARGVDREAHEGALAAGGESWAVWGTGPDRVYPAEHRALAERLAANGALLTEYPPGTPPRRHHFPERNRILAGVASAVVVVEAAARSGALVTARLALEEGREVLAVPGNIFSELSVGPNTLLRVGARPLLTPRDLFEAVGESIFQTADTGIDDGLLELIPVAEALTADDIAARSGAPVDQVLAELLRLELSGDLQRESDGRYLRTKARLPGGSAPRGSGGL